jgi:hypothetical protein
MFENSTGIKKAANGCLDNLKRDGLLSKGYIKGKIALFFYRTGIESYKGIQWAEADEACQ